MKLDVDLINNQNKVYVGFHNDKMTIADIYIFDYDKFYEKYTKSGMTDIETLRNDVIDTYMSLCAIPLNKEQILKDLYIGIYSNLFKEIKL